MSFRTLVDALSHRAVHQGDRIAFTWLVDGDAVVRELSWAELWRGARSVGAALQAQGARGERVLLMYEEGLDYLVALFGCMAAGALAAPVHPPDPRRLARTLPRLQTIARDAGVRFVATSSEIAAAARPAVAGDETLGAAVWLVTPELPDASADWVDPELTPEDLAYLQYTSGSTSTPKGVMISHGNLTHQLTDFDTGYDHGPDSVMVTWLPATHDLGLVYGRFMPLWIGMRCVFLSPAEFMRRPVNWLRAITRYRGTHSPSPNFGYEVVARKVRPDELSALDLSSMVVFLNGAEPIREDSERLFIDTFQAAGLRPEAVTHAMGMSEATAKVVTEPIDRTPPRFAWLDPVAYERNEVVVVPPRTPGARAVASCGRTVLDTVVAIADPATHARLPSRRVGEMWVKGTTVAQGYWNNPEATEATFRARLSDGDGPYLRTGDLAFELDGEIYLCGRLKDVIIVRGQNHHPQDIEWAVNAAHPAMRPNCAAAFAWRDERGEERVGVVAEVYDGRVTDAEEVFGAVRAAVAESGLQVAGIGLLPERGLPKTSSGKIQRSAAREGFLSGSLRTAFRWEAPRVVEESAAPVPDLRARVEAATGRRRHAVLVEHLRATTASLLGLSPEDVAVDRPFGELGLDSVTAVDLLERSAGSLGLSVAGTALFDHPTVDALASFLLGRLEAVKAPAPAAPPPDDAAALAELLALLDKKR
jgi:acyl-CoA synthetase (AMP-forming)/AMP-acid ligase II/aryl carrier-like protein